MRWKSLWCIDREFACESPGDFENPSTYAKVIIKHQVGYFLEHGVLFYYQTFVNSLHCCCCCFIVTLKISETVHRCLAAECGLGTVDLHHRCPLPPPPFTPRPFPVIGMHLTNWSCIRSNVCRYLSLSAWWQHRSDGMAVKASTPLVVIIIIIIINNTSDKEQMWNKITN